jgi:glucokinase
MFDRSVIGVDLDGRAVAIGKVQNNRIVKEYTAKISYQKSEKYIISEIIRAIENVIDDTIVGIGFGVPSLVDLETGVVHMVHNIPSWKRVHLKEKLENHFKIPVYINNDANCFAIGVKYFGKGQNYRNLVGLIIGEGFGAGIINDHHLISGLNCGAGEFGKIPFKDHNYDYYCTQYFTCEHNIAFDVLYDKAKKNDQKALHIFESFGQNLGVAILSIISTLAPDAIIMGGVVAKAFPYFEKGLRKQLATFPFQESIEKIKIDITDQSDIAILGAAALYFDAEGAKDLEAAHSQRIAAENALIQERNMLNAVMDNIPDNIYVKDVESRFVRINTALIKWFGFEDEGVILGKTDFDIFTSEHARQAYEDEQQIIKTGNSMVNFEEKETWEDGSETWVSTSKVPLINTEGDITGLIGISRDITASKQAELELRESRNRLRRAKKDTDNILKNVEEGIFLLNKNLEIGSEYSKALESIIQQKNLTGKKFIELLLNKIKEEDIETTDRYLRLMFNDSIEEETLNSLNPLNQILINFEDENRVWKSSKNLTFKFRRVRNNKGETFELIATVMDVTDQVRLTERLKDSEAQAKKELVWMLSILHVDRFLLQEFIDNVDIELDYIEVVLKQQTEAGIIDFKHLLEKVSCSMNLIKSNAGLLELKFFAEQAQQFEEKVKEIKEKNNILSTDFIPLVLQLSDLRSTLQEVNALIERLGRFHSQLRPKRSYENQFLIKSLQNLVKFVSQDLGKNVKLIHKEFVGDDVPYFHQYLVREIIIQLIRNSISNGIEMPEIRKKNNKPPAAVIEIATFKNNGRFGFTVKDDGMGLDVKKLKQIAESSGKWKPQEIEKWNEETLSHLIFTPEVSKVLQKENLTGRSIDLNIIFNKIKKQSGTVSLDFAKGEFCSFIVTLPTNNKTN